MGVYSLLSKQNLLGKICFLDGTIIVSHDEYNRNDMNGAIIASHLRYTVNGNTVYNGIVVSHVRYTVNGNTLYDGIVVSHVRYTTNWNNMNNAIVVYHVIYASNGNSCIRFAYMCILFINPWWFIYFIPPPPFSCHREIANFRHNQITSISWYAASLE